MNEVYNISARYFHALHGFTAIEPTRYNLNGVHVCPRKEGGVLMVATDGRSLGLFIDEAGHAPEAAQFRLTTVSERSLGAWLSDPAYKPESVRLQWGKIEEDRVGDVEQVGAQDDLDLMEWFEGRIERVHGSYPDWRRLWPEDPGEAVPAGVLFNAGLLARFEACSFNTTTAPFVQIMGKELTGAFIVRTACPDFCGLMMPMRDTGWVDRLAADLERFKIEVS